MVMSGQQQRQPSEAATACAPLFGFSKAEYIIRQYLSGNI